MNLLRKYYIKHPKFRSFLDEIDDKIKTLQFFTITIYIIGAVAFIGLIALSLFLILPDNIKTPVTSIIIAVLSYFILPFILSHHKNRKENIIKHHEQNMPFYLELAELIMDVYQETEQYSQRQKIAKLSNFIAEKYPYICLHLSVRQIDLLYNIKDECLIFFDKENGSKASTDNLYKFAEKFFSELRKQNGLSGEFFLYKKMTEKRDIPKLGTM